MSHPWNHALSSAKQFGGVAKDYLALHNWFDASKAMYAHWRHRALRHHAEGIFMAETIFGVTIKNSAGKEVPTRLVGEQHVREDLGFIPSMQDWFKHLSHQPWMTRGVQKLEQDGEPSDETTPATAHNSVR